MTAAFCIGCSRVWTGRHARRAARLGCAGVDPRLLLAVVMIAAELALLTAVALFFSTFSSSALVSVVLTVGLFVAGLLSADLRGFGGHRERPACCRARRLCHRLGGAGLLGVRYQGPDRSRPRPARGVRLVHARVCRVLRRRRSSQRRWRSFPDGSSDEAEVSERCWCPGRTGWRAWRGGRASRARSRVAVAARHRAAPVPPLGRLGVQMVSVVRRAGGRRVLDSRDPALWARPEVHQDDGPLSTAPSAARPDDDARSAVQRGVPVRRDLPVDGAAERSGRARTRRFGCSRRGSRTIHPAGSTRTTSGSSTTGTPATIGRQPRGSTKAAGMPGAPAWIRPACGGDTRAGRRP